MIAPHEVTVGSQWLTERALKLLRPLMAVIHPAEAKLDLQGRASDHDARADRLESFARPFHLYALLLGHLGDGMPEEAESWRLQLAECLRNGADKEHSAYWGPSTNFHQHVVEMGLLVLSLEICREHFWERLDDETRGLVLDWLETARSVAMHWNNHMFFGVFALEFLRKEGRSRPGDQMLIDGWMRELESMYRGEGWFRDGLNDSADYYNAYAFHYYGLNWCLFFGESQPSRRQFWIDGAKKFLTSFQYVFAQDGGVPNFGRSQTYRFATLAPFGPAIHLSCCPIANADVRRLAEDHLDFFLEKDIYTPEGRLNIGWTNENSAIAESYSCVSSTYWAAKGFSLLLLPPEHPFWMAKTTEPKSVYVDGQAHAPSVGLTLRRFDGDTEIINSGSAIALMNLRYFASKWSKLAYRSSAGTLLPNPDDPHPLDLALVAEFDGRRFGRHVTYPLEFGESCVRCAYTLGEKTFAEMVAVNTCIAWCGSWLFVEHELNATAPCTMLQGGFALGLDQDETASTSKPFEGIRIQSRGRASVLQTIAGFDSLQAVGDFNGETRRHTLNARYQMPVARSDIDEGKARIACLIYFGPDDERATSWIVDPSEEPLRLKHPFYDEWKLPHV